MEARSEKGVGIYKASGEVGTDEILGTSWVKVLRREGTSVGEIEKDSQHGCGLEKEMESQVKEVDRGLTMHAS